MFFLITKNKKLVYLHFKHQKIRLYRKYEVRLFWERMSQIPAIQNVDYQFCLKNQDFC
jgi:hypothetical protein